jgi:sulfur transfer protein SufE
MIREQQDKFTAYLNEFDEWTDKFNFLISEGEALPAQCPESLNAFRIKGCQSRTCLKAYIREDYLYVDAWSNSSVMAGICITLMKIFNMTPVKNMETVDIDFHVKSGLIDHLTPLRRMGLEEMIRRITVLFPHRKTNEI